MDQRRGVVDGAGLREGSHLARDDECVLSKNVAIARVQHRILAAGEASGLPGMSAKPCSSIQKRLQAKNVFVLPLLRMAIHCIPIGFRHRRVSRIRRSTCRTAETARRALRRYLGRGGLNIGWVSRVGVSSGTIAGLFQFDQFGANLCPGKRLVRLCEYGKRCCERSGEYDGLNKRLHDNELQTLLCPATNSPVRMSVTTVYERPRSGIRTAGGEDCSRM